MKNVIFANVIGYLGAIATYSASYLILERCGENKEKVKLLCFVSFLQNCGESLYEEDDTLEDRD